MKLLTLSIIALLVCASAIAQQVEIQKTKEKHSNVVTVDWDPNPESDIASYQVYYGTKSGYYTHFLNVGKETQATLALPPSERCFVIVVAINDSGLPSMPSKELILSYERPTGPIDKVVK